MRKGGPAFSFEGRIADSRCIDVQLSALPVGGDDFRADKIIAERQSTETVHPLLSCFVTICARDVVHKLNLDNQVHDQVQAVPRRSLWTLNGEYVIHLTLC
jgi:hypothetical protein